MKRRGVIITEVLIAMAVFIIGLLALAGSMTFTLRAVTRSREQLIEDRNLVNDVNTYMLKRVISHDVSPSGTQVTKLSSGQQLLVNGKSINYSVYRYKREGRNPSSYYLLQRED